jgi:hypothetical protein
MTPSDADAALCAAVRVLELNPNAKLVVLQTEHFVAYAGRMAKPTSEDPDARLFHAETQSNAENTNPKP